MKFKNVDELFNDFKSLKTNYVNYDFGFDFKNTVPNCLKHITFFDSFSKLERVEEIEYKYFQYRKAFNQRYYKTDNSNIYPFGICINGSYYQPGFFYQLLFILSGKHHPVFSSRSKTEKFKFLKDFFENYGKGFKYGFDIFEQETFDSFQSEYDKKRSVFNIATSHWTGFKGPKMDMLNHSLADAYDTGKEYGMVYKSWSIILKNQYSFKDFFDEKKQRVQESEKNEKPPRITETENIKNFGISSDTIAILLFNEMADHEIISDSVTKDDFIKTITSDWSSSNPKIKIVSTTSFAFLVSELKKSELNSSLISFNFSNIEKSQMFYTEDTDYITGNLLSSSKRSAKSNGKQNEYIQKSQKIIDAICRSLLPKK